MHNLGYSTTNALNYRVNLRGYASRLLRSIGWVAWPRLGCSTNMKTGFENFLGFVILCRNRWLQITGCCAACITLRLKVGRHMQLRLLGSRLRPLSANISVVSPNLADSRGAMGRLDIVQKAPKKLQFQSNTLVVFILNKCSCKMIFSLDLWLVNRQCQCLKTVKETIVIKFFSCALLHGNYGDRGPVWGLVSRRMNCKTVEMPIILCGVGGTYTGTQRRTKYTRRRRRTHSAHTPSVGTATRQVIADNQWQSKTITGRPGGPFGPAHRHFETRGTGGHE